MGKAKAATPIKDTRDLGEVIKKLPSGMFETNKKEKIPAFPGVGIGTKMKLDKSKFVIVGGGKEPEKSASDVKGDSTVAADLEAFKQEMGTALTAKDAEIAELKRQLAAGAAAPKVAAGAANAKAPKVGES